MRPKPALFTLIAALCSVATARATPLVFNVTGDVHAVNDYYYPYGLPRTGTLSGTISFDPNTFNAIAADITVRVIGFEYVDAAIPAVRTFPVHDPNQLPVSDYSLAQYGFTVVGLQNNYGFGRGYELSFEVSDALLDSPVGDPFTSGYIIAYQSRTSGGYYITNGLLTPQGTAAATPEPSSWVFLATGAAGLVGAVRRRSLNV